jgi:phosphoserine phosphatase RsbU/P
MDRKIQYFEPDAMATVLYGVYATESGRLTVSSAGHLPPVLAAPGEGPGPAEIDVSLPIGVADDPPRTSSVIDIPPGALLCCYTDGLVERRDRPLDNGIACLATTLAGLTATAPASVHAGSGLLAEDACAAVMRALVGNAPARDDVAVLVLHRQAEAV